MGRHSKRRKARNKTAQGNIKNRWSVLEDENDTVYSSDEDSDDYDNEVQVQLEQPTMGKRGKRKRNINRVNVRSQLNRLRAAVKTEKLSLTDFINLADKVGTKKELEGTKLDKARQQVPPSLVTYAMDMIKMSYSAVVSFRQILNLYDILPGKKKLVKGQGEKNTDIDERYGFESMSTEPSGKVKGVVVGNLGNMLGDFVNHQKDLHKEEDKVLPEFLDFKLSGDGRQHREGKVGYYMVPLSSMKLASQSGSSCMPILVYNGKDTKEDVSFFGKKIKDYFEDWSYDESKKCIYKTIEGIRVRVIYTGDMVNIWHTCIPKAWKNKGAIIEKEKIVDVQIDIDGLEERGDNSVDEDEQDKEEEEEIERIPDELAELAKGNTDVAAKELQKDKDTNTLNCRCVICGLDIQGFRTGSTKQRVQGVSILGAPTLGFCNLHCDCRVQEWVFALAIKTDSRSESKAKQQITNTVTSVARESWGFITDSKTGKVKSKVLFGGEAKRLAELGGEIIFGKKNKKAVETYDSYVKNVRKYMFMHSDESKARNKIQMEKDLKEFKNTLVRNYGRRAITFYIHILVEHLEEIIADCENFGYSLPQLSQEGVEQANSIFKRTYKRKTCTANEKSALMQVLQLEYRIRNHEWKQTAITIQLEENDAKKVNK